MKIRLGDNVKIGVTEQWLILTFADGDANLELTDNAVLWLA